LEAPGFADDAGAKNKRNSDGARAEVDVPGTVAGWRHGR